MLGFKLQVCDFNISEQERETKEEWKSIYTHLYMYLNIYSQSVTLRRAHLAAAVSGNL